MKQYKKIILDDRVFLYEVKEKKSCKKVIIRMIDFEKITITIPKFFLSSFFLSPENFIKSNKKWVFNNSKRLQQNKKEKLEDKEWRKKKNLFLQKAIERVDFFNTFYNFKYKNIRIKDQNSRWGSCSAKGNLNFNYRIFLLDNEKRDYVIIHELCHLKEMNHSKKFWNLVKKKSPDYKKIRGEFKKYIF